MSTDRLHRALLAPFAAILCLALPTSALADEDSENDFTRDGWYLSAGGVFAYEQMDSAISGHVDSTWGGNIQGGYRMGQNFAGEVEFEMLDEFQVDSVLDHYTLETYSISFALRAYPLARVFEPDSFWSRFQPFAKAGAAWMWVKEDNRISSDDSDGGFAGRLGGGMDFYITNNIALSASALYVLPTGKLDDFDYVSLGAALVYRFGESDY